MAKQQQQRVLVFCAGSHPTRAEEAAYEGPFVPRFRNGRVFDPGDVELETVPGEGMVTDVYTNNPAVKAAYEKLNGSIVQGHTLNVTVHPITPPVAVSSGLPTREELEAMTVAELADEFGVEPPDKLLELEKELQGLTAKQLVQKFDLKPNKPTGGRKRKSDLIAEVLALSPHSDAKSEMIEEILEG